MAEQVRRNNCVMRQESSLKGISLWDITYLHTMLQERPPWITAEMRELIKQAFGVRYSPDQGVRILRTRLKMHLGKPFPHDHHRPADVE